jgi:hypothetical protein
MFRGIVCARQSEGLETPPLLGAHKPLSRQRLPKRASSAPLDGGSGLLGLHLGRLIGRGSFGRVYKGAPLLMYFHYCSVNV